MSDERSGAPDWLLDVGLFVTATLFVEPFLHADVTSLATMQQAVFVALGLHILLSVYHGRFSRLRTASWLSLLIVWNVSFAFGLLSYILPFGQLSFWMAGRVALFIRPESFFDPKAGFALAIAWSVFVLAVIVLDIVVMYASRVRRWRPLTGLLVPLGIPAAAFSLDDIVHIVLATRSPGTFDANLIGSTRVIPSLDTAWAYAILRAVPSKSWAVAALFIIMLLPIGWPWAKARRFNAPPTRAAWTGLWLGLAACWLGLIYCGLQSPTEPTVLSTRALMLFDLGFFLLLPFALRPFVPADADRSAIVFE